VLAVFQRHCARVERASIDEAYLDLTAEVAALQQEEEGQEDEGEDRVQGLGADDVLYLCLAPSCLTPRPLRPPPAAAYEGTHTAVEGHAADPQNALDRLLLLGARLVARIRAAVQEETGFTVSAGVATNKMLAKQASARHKPNKQTGARASLACLHSVAPIPCGIRSDRRCSPLVALLCACFTSGPEQCRGGAAGHDPYTGGAGPGGQAGGGRHDIRRPVVVGGGLTCIALS
jgi:hypothetical protein